LNARLLMRVVSCSLVRKYFFLTSDSIAIFAHYFMEKNIFL
jgi:hypothetical protein